jgi:hypothetical protein
VVVRLRSSHRLRSPSNGAGRTTTARHAEAALRFFMTSDTDAQQRGGGGPECARISTWGMTPRCRSRALAMVSKAASGHDA